MTDGDDRAVSYVIGFALVVSIVLLSGALAFVLGIGSLSGTSQGADVTTGESSVVRTGGAINTIATGDADFRRVTFEGIGGSLSYGAPFSVTVNASNESGETVINDTTITSPSLVYRVAGTTVAYEGGLVARGDEDGYAVASEPSLDSFSARTRVILPGIVGSDQTVGFDDDGGSVRVQLRARSRELSFNRNARDDDEITGNVTIDGSARCGAWRAYLAGDPGFTLTDDNCFDDGAINARYSSQRTFVSLPTVDIEIGN